MKKGLLITVDFWPRTGGVATYYTLLLNTVREFVPVVFTTPLFSDIQKKILNESQPNHRVIRAPFFFQYIWPRWLRLVISLVKLVRQESFDFFFVGDILPVGTVIWFFSHFYTKPYGVFLHGTDIAFSQKTFLKRIISKRILRKARCIIVNSKYTQKQVNMLGVSEKKIFVVYPALSLSEINQTRSLSLREQYGIVNSKKIILGISRLVERKGIQYVLAALSELKKKRQDFLYVHIGTGSYRNMIFKKIHEYGLENCVLFREDAQDDEKHSWLSLASFFVLTPVCLHNDYEGFGIVYLEAAKQGLAAIGSATGGIPEAVAHEKTGLLIQDPAQTKELFALIERLLDDNKLCKRLGQEAKKRVENEFQWVMSAKNFENALKVSKFF